MSTANEITRLSNAKSAIAAAIKNKGVTVPSGTKLDGMAPFIGQIETGGSAQEMALLSVSARTFTTTVHCTDANGYRKTQSGSFIEILADSIVLVEDIPYLYAGGAVMYGGEILGVYYYDDNEYAAILLHIGFSMNELVL